jgi:hypothetical protein
MSCSILSRSQEVPFEGEGGGEVGFRDRDLDDFFGNGVSQRSGIEEDLKGTYSMVSICDSGGVSRPFLTIDFFDRNILPESLLQTTTTLSATSTS